MGVRGLFEAVLDAILPPRERSARTKSRTIGDIPLTPASHELLGAHITTLMDYRDPAVQDLIRSLKYDGSGHAAHLAAQVLADFLREEIAAARTFGARRLLLVPLPLHPSRARERGFNQIALVLERLPQEFRDGTLATLAPGALIRTRATPPQAKLSRAERLKNLRGAFAIPDGSAVRGARIFLIDDVTTTGATLLHASAPLKKSGAEVSLLALARA